MKSYLHGVMEVMLLYNKKKTVLFDIFIDENYLSNILLKYFKKKNNLISQYIYRTGCQSRIIGEKVFFPQ